MKRAIYTMTDLESGCDEVVEANSMDEAIASCEQWVKDGDWGDDGCCVTCRVTNDSTGESESFAVDVAPTRRPIGLRLETDDWIDLLRGLVDEHAADPDAIDMGDFADIADGLCETVLNRFTEAGGDWVQKYQQTVGTGAIVQYGDGDEVKLFHSILDEELDDAGLSRDVKSLCEEVAL